MLLSFYPSKNLGAYGEGGALTTQDAQVAERARRLRDHAQQDRYDHVELGYNYRLNSFQGAVLSVKLKHLDVETTSRVAAAAEYDGLLAGGEVLTPPRCPDGRHVYHQYVIRHPERDALKKHLAQHGIASAVHYPVPIHLQAPFRKFGGSGHDLPWSERLARECLSLPICPHIGTEQIERVCRVIRSGTG